MTTSNKNLRDIDQDEASLTPEEHMESLLFQFVTLYERWSEDRQVAAKQGADIAKLVKEFTAEIQRFASIENAVISKLKTSLDNTTVSISDMMYKGVSHSVDQALEGSAIKIKESVRQAEHLFKEYQSSLNWSHWKIIAITSLTSIAASLLIVWLLMPRPTLPLTDRDLDIYAVGKTFSDLWPTLSKEKQKWFLNATSKKNKATSIS